MTGVFDQVPERSCMVCGCTDSNACPGGCSWADPGGLDGDICSRCQPTLFDAMPP